jgi:hypothetical protein
MRKALAPHTKVALIKSTMDIALKSGVVAETTPLAALPGLLLREHHNKTMIAKCVPFAK